MNIRDNKVNPVKRKFPGPAGILPDEIRTTPNIDIYSQDSYSVFEEQHWKDMSKDFKISNTLHLYDRFNIAWIKKEALTNNFVNEKAPFLAAILESIELSDGQKQKSINIVLKDMTGTIQGTILYNLYQEYLNYMVLGSILVIVQFGVLSCSCDKCDNYHITITPNNLSALYSPNEKIVIKDVEPEDVLKNYYTRIKELENQKKNNIKKVKLMSSNGLNINRKDCLYKELPKSPIIPFDNKIVKDNYNLGNNSHTNFILPKCKSITPTKHFQNEIQNTPSLTKKFTFKKIISKPDNTENCERSASDYNFSTSSEINTNINSSTVHNEEHSNVCKDLLEGIDVNSLFE